MPSEALSPAIAAPSPSAPAAEPLPERLSAFAGFERIASGPAQAVLAQLRSSSLPPDVLVRVFDDATGTRLDLDLRPQAAATASAAGAEGEGAAMAGDRASDGMASSRKCCVFYPD